MLSNLLIKEGRKEGGREGSKGRPRGKEA